MIEAMYQKMFGNITPHIKSIGDVGKSGQELQEKSNICNCK